MSIKKYIRAAFAVSFLLVGGCGGDGLGRHAISGTVTVDGTTVATGNIGFQPMDKGATSGGATINVGKYTIPRDKGLTAGKYRVTINAPKPGTGGEAQKNVAPGEPVPAPQELIPPEWNEKSEHTIDVADKGPFVFDFDVKTKK